MEIEKQGYIYGIPVLIKLSTYDQPEVRGRNIFWDCILAVTIWIASNIFSFRSIPIIEEENS